MIVMGCGAGGGGRLGAIVMLPLAEKKEIRKTIAETPGVETSPHMRNT
jgi:hypothetical protein